MVSKKDDQKMFNVFCMANIVIAGSCRLLGYAPSSFLY
jgi:hypothetical protein